jgi:hypothetical protein
VPGPFEYGGSDREFVNGAKVGDNVTLCRASGTGARYNEAVGKPTDGAGASPPGVDDDHFLLT